VKAPEKKKWRQEWNDRDQRKILEIARGFRGKFGVNERTAWEAAEREYVATQAPSRRKGYLHA
jgi:hypothetical protein